MRSSCGGSTTTVPCWWPACFRWRDPAGQCFTGPASLSLGEPQSQVLLLLLLFWFLLLFLLLAVLVSSVFLLLSYLFCPHGMYVCMYVCWYCMYLSLVLLFLLLSLSSFLRWAGDGGAYGIAHHHQYLMYVVESFCPASAEATDDMSN